MSRKRILYRIKISKYDYEGKTRYLCEIEDDLFKSSFNETTIKKICDGLKKEL